MISPLPLPQSLPIDRVFPNPDQPRTFFDPATLQELANSISIHGLQQPITVVPRHNASGERWMIVMGERRWRASGLAKLAEIQAVVREDLSEAQVQQLALLENLLREDLHIVEEAKGYRKFLDANPEHTIETLATALGFNQPWRVQERLNLLKLDPRLLEGVIKGAIGASQAQEMSRLSIEGQFRLWNAIQDGKCGSYIALRRMATALFDQENQKQLFQSSISPCEKVTLHKVDLFIQRAGRLLTSIGAADLDLLTRVPKSNASAAAEQLGMLEKLCRDAKNALLENAAKQEALRSVPVEKIA